MLRLSVWLLACVVVCCRCSVRGCLCVAVSLVVVCSCCMLLSVVVGSLFVYVLVR